MPSKEQMKVQNKQVANLLGKSVKVVLCGEEFTVTEKPIRKMVEWRHCVSGIFGKLFSNASVTEDSMDFGKIFSYVLTDGLDQVTEAFKLYCTEIPPEYVDNATDEELFAAIEKVMELVMPFFTMIINKVGGSLAT